MGKKYIIELEETPFVQHFENGIGETVYRVKGFNSLVFDWNGLQMLTPYTEDSAYAHGYAEAVAKYREIRDELEKQAYQRGYEGAYDTAYADAEEIYESGKGAMYQKGLKDAWDAARKIVSMPDRNFINSDILDLDHGESIFTKYSASKAIEKIRQYEQEKEEQIQVGDEVTFLPNNAKGIVTECHVPDVYSDNDKYAVWCGGTMEYVLKQHLTKTGRHFPEITEVLQKMKES